MRKELPVLRPSPAGHVDGRVGSLNLTRRELIQLGALSVGAVAFTGCQPPKAEMTAQSRARLAEDLVAGHDSWFATACSGCAAGCGAIVRVVAGRAKKLEGNPSHPVNLGASCARAQAVVQEQYHPDRITGPLLRTGQRGSGSFLPISWDDAIDRVVTQLGLLRDQARAGEVALLTQAYQGPRARLLGGFAEAYGGAWFRLDPLAESPVRAAVRWVFGTDRLPAFDLANSRFLLSFGADFLGSWLSPVHYGRQYGIFRQGRYAADQFEPRAGDRPRGYMVHVEPRLSTTAASADEWIWIRPGHEGMLALSLAQVILAEGLTDPAGAAAFGDAGALAPYAPERVADQTGLPAERIRTLARRFATEQPALALAGGPAAAQSNGTDTLAAVLALNILVGNVGRPGGVLLDPPPPPISALPAPVGASNLAEWQDLAERLRAGSVQLVLLDDANPAYGLPGVLQFGDALQQAPLIVSFSSFLNDSTALADLILPTHLPLEEWGADLADPAPGRSVLSLQQPVVRPSHDTRCFGDVLLQIAEQLGGPVRSALPWPSFRDMIRATVREWAAQGPSAPADDVTFERTWTQALQQGGIWPQEAAPSPPAPAAGASIDLSSWRQPTFAGDEAAYPFHLVVFPHHALADGRLAHLPWLQATPDPITTVTWQSWVEINPGVAAQHGLREGDVVGIETTAGRIDLPVYVNPAASPETLSVPMGQGHTQYGRWAEHRGINPMAILAPVVDEATGALAYGATRARLIVTGRTTRLPKLEGTVPARQLEEEPVLQVTREA